MNSRDLIETARGLTELSPRRPSQANLRRALSTAYYAVFHSLAGAIADILMGKGRNEAWHQVYRKVWREAEDSPGYPMVHFIPKSEIGRRDSATVYAGPAPLGPCRLTG